MPVPRVEFAQTQFATEWPCARCADPVPVTADVVEMAKWANHVRAAKGEQLKRTSEQVLCPRCYRLWQQERERRSHAAYREDLGHWKRYLAGDIGPEEVTQLLGDERSFTWKEALLEIEKKREDSRGKRGRKQRDEAAGFGDG